MAFLTPNVNTHSSETQQHGGSFLVFHSEWDYRRRGKDRWAIFSLNAAHHWPVLRDMSLGLTWFLSPYSGLLPIPPNSQI